MRLIYLANSRIPTEKAHGLEVMKLCEALTDFFDLELILPKRKNNIKDAPFFYYQIKKKFKIVRLPVIDTIAIRSLGRLGFWIETMNFSIAVLAYLIFKSSPRDIIFSHDNAPLLAAALIRGKTYYDIHDFPVKGLFFYRRLLEKLAGIITTNQWKKNELIKRFNFPSKKILVYPNGVDIEEFDIIINKSDARKNLGLPPDKKLVVYTGQLFSWKGVDTLMEAGKFLDNSFLVYIVGGNKEDIKRAQQKFFNNQRLVFAGQRPHAEIPLWLKAADVLVLPNTAKEDISKYFTSPMKLLEYMVSKTPIIASDIPSVRGIANKEIVNFFNPDDARDLAETVKGIINNYEKALIKASNAYSEVQKYTWKERARQIKNFIEAAS